MVFPVLGDKAEALLVRHAATQHVPEPKAAHFAVPPSFFRSLQMSVLSRDLVAAKMAFEVGDAELSKKAHAARAAPEKHSGYLEVKPEHELPTASLTPHLGKQVNTFKLSSLADSMEVRAGHTMSLNACSYHHVRGSGRKCSFEDAVCTALYFTAHFLSYLPLLIISFANLLADALGMAVGDYLRCVDISSVPPYASISSKAEDDHREAERRREKSEMELWPEQEKREMIDVYMEKGFTENEAREVVELLWPYKDAFLGA